MQEKLNQQQMSRVHELTDEQIDRMVADKLEPLKSLNVEKARTSKIWSYDNWSHQYVPVQFTRDWSACGMLLEQLPNALVTRLPASRSWAVNSDWLNDNPTKGFGHQFGIESPNLLRAICEAFLLATNAAEVKE